MYTFFWATLYMCVCVYIYIYIYIYIYTYTHTCHLCTCIVVLFKDKYNLKICFCVPRHIIHSGPKSYTLRIYIRESHQTIHRLSKSFIHKSCQKLDCVVYPSLSAVSQFQIPYRLPSYKQHSFLTSTHSAVTKTPRKRKMAERASYL